MKAIIPAIDISEGACVRLSQGDFLTKKIYSHNPVDLAREYISLGARRIHIVDLDAAFKRGNNRALIGDICKECNSECLIEVGGGIHTIEQAKMLIDMGVDRLCLGTILVQDMLSVLDWVRKLGNVFIASVDALHGEVRIAGWLKESKISTIDFITQLQQVPLRSIEFTNISNDGMLSGTDLESTVQIADVASVPIIVSGGVGNAEDIDKVMHLEQDNVAGVIVGKALYEGLVDLETMFKKYPSPSCVAW